MSPLPEEPQSTGALGGQAAKSRPSQEYVISPRGDAILQFANLLSPDQPQLCFLVSSYMLAECSPFFGSVFDQSPPRHRGAPDPSEAPAASGQALSSTASFYQNASGHDIQVYQIQYQEANEHDALTILLHAAHMRSDLVPRDISFDQFIAIAEVCRRYQCTSPLEVFVECKWLPHWMPRATEDMPFGFLFISYVFGLRRLFTRMSKTIILNMQTREDFTQQCDTSSTMTWPQELTDKIWAVRSAKVEQVYDCCRDLLQEYLSAPIASRGRTVVARDDGSSSPRSPSVSGNELMTTRCPRGSRACDAMNLGWLFMSFNGLGIMPQINPFTTFLTKAPSLSEEPAPARSLRELLDALRFMPSNSSQIHDGQVCDFQNAFRSALNDVFNSISGLTLYDISGREHGWSLSKQKANLPQRVFKLEETSLLAVSLRQGPPAYASLNVGDVDIDRGDVVGSAVCEIFSTGHERILPQIFQFLNDFRDIKAVAMVNKATYATYKAYSLNHLTDHNERTGRRPHGQINTHLREPSVSSDISSHRRHRSSDNMTIRRINSSLSGYRSPPAPAKLDRATATAGRATSTSRDPSRSVIDMNATAQQEEENFTSGQTLQTATSPVDASTSWSINPQNQEEIHRDMSDPARSEQGTPHQPSSTKLPAAPLTGTTLQRMTSTEVDATKSIPRDDHLNEKFLKADFLQSRKPENKTLASTDDKVSRNAFGQILGIYGSDENMDSTSRASGRVL